MPRDDNGERKIQKIILEEPCDTHTPAETRQLKSFKGPVSVEPVGDAIIIRKRPKVPGKDTGPVFTFKLKTTKKTAAKKKNK